MNDSVYEVIERSYLTIGIREEYESDFKEPFADSRVFYNDLHQAKKHVKDWAKLHGAETEERGWKASIKKPTHHNEWETSKPEFKVEEIEIKKHEVRGYFYRTA